jgi:hypothetical protein
MPYQVSWLLENRIILARHFGVLTGEELLAYLDESMAMRDRANEINGPGGPLINTLTDARRLEASPMTLREIQPMMRALRQQRTGWSVYVHPGRMERFLAGVGHQFAGVRYRLFAAMPEAITFLTGIEPLLRDAPGVDVLLQKEDAAS